jgi:RNA polymerase sigma-70 factor, ECF subfamily
VPNPQQRFEEIAMPHLAALLRVARRLTLDQASAEDLVQETMLLAWRGFHGFEAGTNARAWLFKILINAFRNEARKVRRESPGPLPGIDFAPEFQRAAEIAEAVDALPVEQRTVLLLCVVEGFTSREAAEILDVPMGTVMSRLSRAREELRRSLAPLAKEAYR